MKDTSEYLDRYQGEQAQIVEEDISDYNLTGRNATVFHVRHQKNWYGRVRVSWTAGRLLMQVEIPDGLIPAIIRIAGASQRREVVRQSTPISMILWCPGCSDRHLDVGEFATKPHHTHACQTCGMVWRPAIENTVGVQFLPGFKNE